MLDERDPDYSALRLAMEAAPADDLPSLVLADWLDEHGEPDRAELLRIEVALKSATACRREGRSAPSRDQSTRTTASSNSDRCSTASTLV